MSSTAHRLPAGEDGILEFTTRGDLDSAAAISNRRICFMYRVVKVGLLFKC